MCACVRCVCACVCVFNISLCSDKKFLEGMVNESIWLKGIGKIFLKKDYKQVMCVCVCMYVSVNEDGFTRVKASISRRYPVVQVSPINTRIVTAFLTRSIISSRFPSLSFFAFPAIWADFDSCRMTRIKMTMLAIRTTATGIRRPPTWDQRRRKQLFREAGTFTIILSSW